MTVPCALLSRKSIQPSEISTAMPKRSSSLHICAETGGADLVVFPGTHHHRLSSPRFRREAIVRRPHGRCVTRDRASTQETLNVAMVVGYVARTKETVRDFRAKRRCHRPSRTNRFRAAKNAAAELRRVRRSTIFRAGPIAIRVLVPRASGSHWSSARMPGTTSSTGRASAIRRDPVEELMHQGADLSVSINASPFNMGKREQRRQIFHATAQRFSMPDRLRQSGGRQRSACFRRHSFAVSRRR